MIEMRFTKLNIIPLILLIFSASCNKSEKAVRYSEEEFNHKVDSMSAEIFLNLEKASEKNLEIRRRIELRYLIDSLGGKIDSMSFLPPLIPEEDVDIPLILHDTLDY